MPKPTKNRCAKPELEKHQVRCFMNAFRRNDNRVWIVSCSTPAWEEIHRHALRSHGIEVKTVPRAKAFRREDLQQIFVTPQSSAIDTITQSLQRIETPTKLQ